MSEKHINHLEGRVEENSSTSRINRTYFDEKTEITDYQLELIKRLADTSYIGVSNNQLETSVAVSENEDLNKLITSISTKIETLNDYISDSADENASDNALSFKAIFESIESEKAILEEKYGEIEKNKVSLQEILVSIFFYEIYLHKICIYKDRVKKFLSTMKYLNGETVNNFIEVIRTSAYILEDTTSSQLKKSTAGYLYGSLNDTAEKILFHIDEVICDEPATDTDVLCHRYYGGKDISTIPESLHFLYLLAKFIDSYKKYDSSSEIELLYETFFNNNEYLLYNAKYVFINGTANVIGISSVLSTIISRIDDAYKSSEYITSIRTTYDSLYPSNYLASLIGKFNALSAPILTLSNMTIENADTDEMKDALDNLEQNISAYKSFSNDLLIKIFNSIKRINSLEEKYSSLITYRGANSEKINQILSFISDIYKNKIFSQESIQGLDNSTTVALPIFSGTTFLFPFKKSAAVDFETWTREMEGSEANIDSFTSAVLYLLYYVFRNVGESYLSNNVNLIKGYFLKRILSNNEYTPISNTLKSRLIDFSAVQDTEKRLRRDYNMVITGDMDTEIIDPYLTSLFPALSTINKIKFSDFIFKSKEEQEPYFNRLKLLTIYAVQLCKQEEISYKLALVKKFYNKKSFMSIKTLYLCNIFIEIISKFYPTVSNIENLLFSKNIEDYKVVYSATGDALEEYIKYKRTDGSYEYSDFWNTLYIYDWYLVKSEIVPLVEELVNGYEKNPSWEAFTLLGEAIMDKLKKCWNSVKKFFKELTWEKVGKWLLDIGAGIWNWTEKKVLELIDFGKELLESFKEEFTEPIDNNGRAVITGINRSFGVMIKMAALVPLLIPVVNWDISLYVPSGKEMISVSTNELFGMDEESGNPLINETKILKHMAIKAIGRQNDGKKTTFTLNFGDDNKKTFEVDDPIYDEKDEENVVYDGITGFSKTNRAEKEGASKLKLYKIKNKTFKVYTKKDNTCEFHTMDPINALGIVDISETYNATREGYGDMVSRFKCKLNALVSFEFDIIHEEAESSQSEEADALTALSNQDTAMI